LFSVAGTEAGGVELQFCCQTYCTYFCTCLDWFIRFWMENGKVFQFTRSQMSAWCKLSAWCSLLNCFRLFSVMLLFTI